MIKNTSCTGFTHSNKSVGKALKQQDLGIQVLPMSTVETVCCTSSPIHLAHLTHAVIVFLFSKTPNLLWISKYLPSAPRPILPLPFKK